MGKSSRSIKHKRPIKESEKIESYAQNIKSDYLRKSDKTAKAVSSNFRFLRWGTIIAGLFVILLLTGLFSPGSNPPNNDFINNEELPLNTFTQQNGEKISVVLYSSPTCGCCHNYVAYLNDNGFDTFQKRTEEYQDIKDENLIPENQRSCHTALVGDYFVEGHIPLSVVYDMLEDNPDIDGISLPNMPAGSPGMGGDKNEDWVISSIANGQVVGVFATV